MAINTSIQAAYAEVSMSTDSDSAVPASPTNEAIATQAHEERRLGLLILENKTGAALATGVPHFPAADLWERAGSPTRRAECLLDLGKLHTKSGNHGDAAKVLTEALRVFEGSN